jgi:hypothetical protein
MKKIPTLFEREFGDHRVVGIKPVLTSPDLQWVLDGKGIATVKIDGTCCAIIDGRFYKRYDAKKGKKPPENAIPCCDPDPVTGHWPHWIPVTSDDPGSRWHIIAKENAVMEGMDLTDGTYEAVGPHFNGNPHKLGKDTLFRHGDIVIEVDRTFEGIRKYLEEHEIEGIVFWKDGEPWCKIKRSDFGYKWPVN